jgi:hypothetical protein
MSDALHQQILDAYEATLATLDLGGTQGRIYQTMTFNDAWAANVTFPCLVLAPVGTEQVLSGTSSTDEIGYPVTVRIVDRQSSETQQLGDYLLWLQTIRDAFHNQRLARVDEVYWSEFQSSPIPEPGLEAYQIISMPRIFQVRTRWIRS